MEILGYLALGGMGITLGLIGAGGSILTIPILTYLFGIPVLLATRYSLAVVSFSAIIATIRYRNNILFKKALVFLTPSILSVFCVRHFIIPRLPLTIGNTSIDKILLTMLIILMAIAGYLMIKNTIPSDASQLDKKNNIKIIAIGASLGILMGFLGAGGGFLIIPTLIIFMQFTMKDAISTSLFIITVNSFIGFSADKYHFALSDWINLAKYLTCAFIGMSIGLYIAKYIKGENLKKIFGYFILAVGIAMIINEFIR